MINTEPITTGLKRCIMTNSGKIDKYGNGCSVCPYRTPGKLSCDMIPLLNDALNAIQLYESTKDRETQSPQLMTIDEVLSADYCVLEINDKQPIWDLQHAILDVRCIDSELNNRIIVFKDDDDNKYIGDIRSYGRYWRCWTSKPEMRDLEAHPFTSDK